MQDIGEISIPEQFAMLSKIMLRDYNKNDPRKSWYRCYGPYTRKEIRDWLHHPEKYEKELRRAAIFIYNTSAHFRRLINYFVSLSDLSYIISPVNVDSTKASESTYNSRYRKTLKLLDNMDIKNQFPKILRVCLREDIFYGTMFISPDCIMVQQLPSDYCRISSQEGNVFNVAFDFSYFDDNIDKLEYYPEEFTVKYQIYREAKEKKLKEIPRWQELDSPRSFAIKCNDDILPYAIPPFAGIFNEIFDLEDYEKLKLAKAEMENYALLVMRLGLSDDGDWQLEYDRAKKFWENLNEVTPEQVGTVLSPMDIEKISFERNHDNNDNTITEAEQRLFTAAGVSSLLFNNAKASANALLLSIKADQAITYGIVKNIECAINRFIQDYSYGKNFRITFLDVSPYNRKESGDMYLKACQYGIPMISYYCASQGLSQSDMEGMTFLENKVLHLNEQFTPLQSGNSISSDKTGRPEEDAEDLTDDGEATRERDYGG